MPLARIIACLSLSGRKGGGERLAQWRPSRGLIAGALSLLLIFSAYCFLAWLASGGDAWWHIDVIGNLTIFSGDDAYRFFLGRSGPDFQALWFSFDLPLALTLDWLLTTVVNDQLLLSRYIKAFLITLALAGLCKSGLRLGLDRKAVATAMVLLALHPLYFFVGMSFYGEAWLMVLVSLTIYCLVSRRELPALIIVSLMPLVRPEGLFYVLALGGWLAWQRRWREAVIPFVPGFLYLVLILSVGPGLIDYVDWRPKINQVYHETGDWIGSGAGRFATVFFVPWFLVSWIGLALPSARSMLPLSLAALVSFVYYPFSAFIEERSSFEPRYLASTLPVLTIGFAACLNALVNHVRTMAGGRLAAPALLVVVAFVCVQAQARSSLGIDRVVDYYWKNGAFPPDMRDDPWSIGSWFHGISSWGLEKNREAARVVADMTRANQDIAFLAFGDIRLFYHLDPDKVRKGVKMVFVPVPSEKIMPGLGGRTTAGYFNEPPYGRRFTLAYAREGTPQILYVDNLDMERYPYHWRVGHNHIFLFSTDLRNNK